MDLFTHLMLSYIWGTIFGQSVGGISEYQLLYMTVAGIVPDFDVFMYPLWKRYPRLRHHGVTHTLLFQVFSGIFSGALIQLVWGLPALSFIPLGIFAGLFHVFCDLLTNYPVPLFAPYSWKGYSWTVDSAVNPYWMAPSILLIIYFSWLRVQKFDYLTFQLYLTVYGALMVAHMLLKLGIKFHLKRKFTEPDVRADAYPTFTYRDWYVMLTRHINGANLTEYRKVRFGREGLKTMFFEVEVPHGKAIDTKMPIKDIAQAVVYSYSLVTDRFKSLAVDDNAASVATGRKDGGWDVFWFKWWSRYWNGAKGIQVTILPDGKFEIKETARDIEI